MRKPPSLRNNNGALQLRVRIDGKDAFINRLGRWNNPSDVAKASALSAKIWADYCEGSFDTTLRSYQPSNDHADTGLLEGLRHLAESNRQGRTIHAYRTLRRYGKTLRNKSDVDQFVQWMLANGLQNRTIDGILCEFRRVCPESSKHLFKHKLKVNKGSSLSDVLSTEEITLVLEDLRVNEVWFYPLFFLWLSSGLRNAEIRGLTWDCIHWGSSEIVIHKTLRVDGLNTHRYFWSTTKTGKERVVPIGYSVIKVLQEHKSLMSSKGIYDSNGLVFVTPITHKNVYDSLLGKVWKRSLARCGIKPRRLYAQRHSFLSHALAIGNSPADLAQMAGHSTQMLLKTYAKPTGRIRLPEWQTEHGSIHAEVV